MVQLNVGGGEGGPLTTTSVFPAGPVLATQVVLGDYLQRH